MTKKQTIIVSILIVLCVAMSSYIVSQNVTTVLAAPQGPRRDLECVKYYHSAEVSTYIPTKQMFATMAIACEETTVK